LDPLREVGAYIEMAKERGAKQTDAKIIKTTLK